MKEKRIKATIILKSTSYQKKKQKNLVPSKLNTLFYIIYFHRSNVIHTQTKIQLT